MVEDQGENGHGPQVTGARYIEFLRKVIPVDQTLQHTSARGLKYALLHDRTKILSKILQYLALHYLTPPQLRVRFQAWRGVRFKDPKSVFIGDNVNFDERVPENITLGRGVWIAAGCRIVAHRFLSYRFAEKADVVFEDYVRVGVNAVIVGPVRISEGATILPCSLVMKDVPPYSVVRGVPGKPIGRIPRKLVDYELLAKGDFETGTFRQGSLPSDADSVDAAPGDEN